MSPTQIPAMSEYAEAIEVAGTPLRIARLASPAATHQDDLSAANSFRQAERNLSNGDGEAEGMYSGDPVPPAKSGERPSQQPQERTAVASERASAQ